MGKAVTTGKVAGAPDTNRGYSQMHGVGKMKFSWTPQTGISSGDYRSKDSGTGTRGAMFDKIKMRPPPSGKKGTGSGPGKKPTEYTQFNKGLIVRGKKQLLG